MFNVTVNDIGDANHKCHFCGALMWKEEAVAPEISVPYLVFTQCCKQGKVFLPQLRPAPLYLHQLLSRDSGSLGRHFQDNIRAYNSMFQFTSLGAKIDHSVNDGRGPYTFRISGQAYQRIGSLVPPLGESARFAQLYVFDTSHEVSNRISSLTQDATNGGFNLQIFEGLIGMLDETNEVVKVFRSVQDRYESILLFHDHINYTSY